MFHQHSHTIACFNQRIGTWYGKYTQAVVETSKKKLTGPKRYKKLYTVRDTVQVLFGDRAKEIAKTHGKSGSGKFLGSYPDAITEVMTKLTPAELKQAQDAAEQWSTEGQSLEIKIK